MEVSDFFNVLMLVTISIYLCEIRIKQRQIEDTMSLYIFCLRSIHTHNSKWDHNSDLLLLIQEV